MTKTVNIAKVHGIVTDIYCIIVSTTLMYMLAVIVSTVCVALSILLSTVLSVQTHCFEDLPLAYQK